LSTMKNLPHLILSLTLLLTCAIATAASTEKPKHPSETDKIGRMEPFKLFDNIYYVGDSWVSSYLVVTETGLVLIDTLDMPYSHWIPGNIKKLGFKPEKLTHIIITHGHSDHVGGAEFLSAKYHAKVLISKEALALATEQSKSVDKINQFKPPKNVQLVEDNQSLNIGGQSFTFYATPGHTQGDRSIELVAKHNGANYRALTYGGMGDNFSGLDLAQKYVASVARITALNTPDHPFAVNLANHPPAAQLFERRDSAKNSVNPYIDQEGFAKFLLVLKERGDNKLKVEMGEMEKSKMNNKP
jgi:metallo-beta-lactamase class B